MKTVYLLWKLIRVLERGTEKTLAGTSINLLHGEKHPDGVWEINVWPNAELPAKAHRGRTLAEALAKGLREV